MRRRGGLGERLEERGIAVHVLGAIVRAPVACSVVVWHSSCTLRGIWMIPSQDRRRFAPRDDRTDRRLPARDFDEEWTNATGLNAESHRSHCQPVP